MGVNVVKLGELCEILDSKRKPVTKKDRVAGEYPYYGATGVQDYVADYIFDEKLVLVGEDGAKWGAGENTAYAISGKCWVNNHAHVLRPNRNKVLDNYIIYYLNQLDLRPYITGAIIEKLNQEQLRNILIPLPTIEEQNRIVTLMDKADEIRAKKKLANDKLDEFLKSTFISMFGDPVRNEKNFKKDTFGAGITTLSDYHANGSYEILRQHVELLSKPDYALMIRTTDLENKNYTDDVNYITEEAYNFLEKSKIYGGEIIINKIGSAGKVYFMPNLNRPVSLGMNAFLLRFNENLLNNVFTYYMLISNSVTTEIQKRVKGAVTKTITKDAVREIPIIYPPMELQNKFAKIVEKVEAQKQKNELVIEQMNNLFNALSQKAFKGDL